MKNERILKWRNRFERKLLVFALLAAQAGFASVAGATYSLPAGRSVTWAGNAGVKGDIPSRTTIYKSLNPSGADDAPAIQAAISGCPAGQVVQLNAGTFTVRSSITVKSGITLRGAGMGKTIIKGASGMSGGYVVGIRGAYSLGTAFNVTAGLTKNSTTITTSSAHGWKAGDVIIIDQLNNASDDPVVSNVGYSGPASWDGRESGKRSLGQLVKVVSVPTSTTATLEIPLYWNFDSSLTPQALKLNGMTTNAGIEDLTVDNGASGSSAQSSNNGTIVLADASNCWLLRVEAIGSYQNLVRLLWSYRNTIRGCRLHKGIPVTATDGSSSFVSSRAYGIACNYWNSANLIENNELYHLYMALKMAGPFSGNVVSYNYFHELFYSPVNWQVEGIGFHGAHPTMNLFEGNFYEGRIAADNVWGSSSHNTFFRNRVYTNPKKTGAQWAFDIQYHAQYFTFVGNVIGTNGVESTYELNNVSLSGQKAIYRLGYTSDGDKDAAGNDARVSATMLRHANWDSATNGTVWNGSDDRTLPASLYLGGKPSWWGTLQWPCIGPDVSPMYPAAGATGSGTPWNTNTVLAPPNNLKAL